MVLINMALEIFIQYKYKSNDDFSLHFKNIIVTPKLRALIQKAAVQYVYKLRH